MKLHTPWFRPICLILFAAVSAIAFPEKSHALGRFGVGVPIAADNGIAIVGHSHGLGGRREWRSGIDMFSGADLYDVATGEHLYSLVPENVDAIYTRESAAAERRFSYYGYDVAIDGHYAVVGAPQAHSAHVFDTRNGAYVTPLTVAPLDEQPSSIASGWFGRDVAVADGIAAVTAPHWIDDEKGTHGAVFLFDTATGDLLHTLRQAQPDIDGRASFFGGDVAIDGGLVLTSDSTDDRQGENAGAAYLFDAASGSQLSVLVPENPVPEGRFGASLDLEGKVAAVGTRWADAVYTFDAETGGQLAKLTSDGSDNPKFGDWIDIQGDNVLVGSPTEGAAYLFNAYTGERIARFDGSDLPWSFGGDVAIDGDTLLVTSEAPLPRNLYAVSDVFRYLGPAVTAFTVVPEPTTTGLVALLVVAFLANNDRTAGKLIDRSASPSRRYLRLSASAFTPKRCYS